MTALDAVSALLAAALFVYLAVALLAAEKFG